MHLGGWMLALGASIVGVGPALAQHDKPARPLPAEIVAAWEKAGAQRGWMTPHMLDVPVFRVGGEGKDGEVPAFQFMQWHAGVLVERVFSDEFARVDDAAQATGSDEALTHAASSGPRRQYLEANVLVRAAKCEPRALTVC
jgi:hypothetical protein